VAIALVGPWKRNLEKKGVRLAGLLAMACADPKTRDRHLDAAKRLDALFPGAIRGVFVEAIAQLLGVVDTNAHEMLDISGGGLFPIASLMNHSCVENAMFSTSGRTMLVSTIRPIAPGEEIVYSYTAFYRPTSDRQAKLRAQYDFECACPLCTTEPDRCRAFVCTACAAKSGDSKLDSDSSSNKPDGASELTSQPAIPERDRGVISPCGAGTELSQWRCLGCKRTIDSKEQQTFLDRENSLLLERPERLDIDAVVSEGILHESHYALFWAMDKQATLLAQMAQYERAEQMILRLLRCVSRVCTPYQDRGTYWDMLAGVRIELGKKAEALEAYRKAYEIRRVACGNDSPHTVAAMRKAHLSSNRKVNVKPPHVRQQPGSKAT